jgi:hypothetical protein
VKLETVPYTAMPHASKVRNHKVPLEVIEKLTGRTDHCALDGERCLFEMLLITDESSPVALPPVVLRPASGGEVYCGKKACPQYPDPFPRQYFLLVKITGPLRVR